MLALAIVSSFLLLQVVEHAIKNGWAVVYIPRGGYKMRGHVTETDHS